jgi:hypothetical protein
MSQTLGNPRSKDQLLPFPGKTDSHPHYKYPQRSRYTLAEIIVIKPLIHILLRTNLSIGVGLVDTPASTLTDFTILHEKARKTF